VSSCSSDIGSQDARGSRGRGRAQETPR
jgi:hypothetical protein